MKNQARFIAAEIVGQMRSTNLPERWAARLMLERILTECFPLTGFSNDEMSGMAYLNRAIYHLCAS